MLYWTIFLLFRGGWGKIENKDHPSPAKAETRAELGNNLLQRGFVIVHNGALLQESTRNWVLIQNLITGRYFSIQRWFPSRIFLFIFYYRQVTILQIKNVCHLLIVKTLVFVRYQFEIFFLCQLPCLERQDVSSKVYSKSPLWSSSIFLTDRLTEWCT